jgi:hypothetical protein
MPHRKAHRNCAVSPRLGGFQQAPKMECRRERVLVLGGERVLRQAGFLPGWRGIRPEQFGHITRTGDTSSKCIAECFGVYEE